jgi:hypothetical protein
MINDVLRRAPVGARLVVAGAQLCYYNAVAHLSVGVALLLAYPAPVPVIGCLVELSGSVPANTASVTYRPTGNEQTFMIRRATS